MEIGNPRSHNLALEIKNKTKQNKTKQLKRTFLGGGEDEEDKVPLRKKTKQTEEENGDQAGKRNEKNR